VRDHIHLGYAVTDYGNQGTTVDHGSVLLESSISAAGVYVGATRGRCDNTIHIVADDLEDAKAQFMATMNRDRADRGLDQARADLAEQLPKHTMAVPPRIRDYIDNMSRMMTQQEVIMERLQPLADHHDKAQAFQEHHQTTVAQARHEAHRAQQAVSAKQAELEVVREQRHRQITNQLRLEIQDEVSDLQAKEHRARNAGIFTRAKAKHDARTTRVELETRYGIELPGTDDERITGPNRFYDDQSVNTVAEYHSRPHPPVDKSLSQLRDQVEQLRSQASHAVERAESLQGAWDPHVGPAPNLDGNETYKAYLGAQRRHAEAQDMIARASNPEHHDELLDLLETQAHKKAQRQQQRPTPQKSSDMGAATYLQRQRLQQYQPGRDGPER